MGVTVPGSVSPVQEPFTFPDDWDDWFAQWTGDEFPSLFGDLSDGTDLSVGAAPSNVFDYFPNGPDLDVGVDPSNLLDDYLNGAGLENGVGPSNLCDDYLNGADMNFGIGPSTLLDDFPNASSVNVGGESFNLINDFPIGLDMDVHDGSESSANYQGALTYHIETLSLPTATDPGLLARMGYSDEDSLRLSHLETTGPTVPQDQPTSFTNFEPQPSWSTQTDGTTLSSFEYGTINDLQGDVCHAMAMPDNGEGVADSSTAANCLTLTISKTVFDPSHADSADYYPQQSAGLAELISPTSLSVFDTRRSNRDPLLGYPKGAISVLEETQPTCNLALDDRPLGNKEKDRNQPYLGWTNYDQSSFTDNTIAPRPIHTCELPDNRKRGRRAPLSQSKRKKIAEMRQLKSCLLCRMKKKDCDNGTPCKRCLYAARSRPSLLRCLRAPLVDLTAAFIPPVLFLYSKVEDASSRLPDLGFNNNLLVQGQLNHSLPGLSLIGLVVARESEQQPLTSSFLSRLSGARGIFNIWAESLVEETESFSGRTISRKLSVVKVIRQVYIDRARPSVIKDALKILLLTCLVEHIKDHERSGYYYECVLGYNGIRFQTCIRSLIERILRDLLPRLQTLLLHRCDADWTVVVSAMTALSMTAYTWIPMDSWQYLEGRLSNIENGWNVILGLYAAAYRGKHLVRASSATKSSIAQSEEIALRLVDELKTWIEKDGDIYRRLERYSWRPKSSARKFKLHIGHTFKYVARLISDEDGQGKHPATG